MTILRLFHCIPLHYFFVYSRVFLVFFGCWSPWMEDMSSGCGSSHICCCSGINSSINTWSTQPFINRLFCRLRGSEPLANFSKCVLSGYWCSLCFSSPSSLPASPTLSPNRRSATYPPTVLVVRGTLVCWYTSASLKSLVYIKFLSGSLIVDHLGVGLNSHSKILWKKVFLLKPLCDRLTSVLEVNVIF